ncbi:hypothetical protein ABIB40_003560 [Pedobacter sp. UYP30]|uniref:lipocalin family protein n=1 Tax=Pedobacter sp. UYP30 TaxID=1756400 RepID=UPI003396CB39
MKKQNTLLVILLTIATSFVACKKDTTSLKSQLIGKWNVTKIEGIDSPVDDYFTFTSNDNDQVERNLGTNTTIGTYIVVANTFNMSFSDGNYYCTDVILDGNTLQFNAKNDKDNTTSTYSLTR